MNNKTLLDWLEKAAQMADMQYRSVVAPEGASCAHDAPMPSSWKWLAENIRQATGESA